VLGISSQFYVQFCLKLSERLHITSQSFRKLETYTYYYSSILVFYAQPEVEYIIHGIIHQKVEWNVTFLHTDNSGAFVQACSLRIEPVVISFTSAIHESHTNPLRLFKVPFSLEILTRTEIGWQITRIFRILY